MSVRGEKAFTSKQAERKTRERKGKQRSEIVSVKSENGGMQGEKG